MGYTRHKPKHNRKLLFIIVAAIVIVGWIKLAALLLGFLVTPDDDLNAIGAFFFSCIFAPLWEELAYRHAPLQIARKLQLALNQNFVVPVAILSSAVFGINHNNGAVSLLMQGIGGLVLCWVYVRNGYSYWSSVVAHCLWNISIIYLLP